MSNNSLGMMRAFGASSTWDEVKCLELDQPKCPVEQVAEIDFHLSLGALIRREVVFEIQTAAKSCGLKCTVEESRGWWSSNYYFTVKGDRRTLTVFRKTLNRWFEEIAQEGK